MFLKKIYAQSALDKHLHKCLAEVLTAKCKRQKKERIVEEGVGSFFFSFHIWICFNAFIQMHPRYCPTVTSQFTIKIRFCFLPSLFFPTFLAWVECSVGKAVCMQIRATQGELSHGSAGTGTLCSPPVGGKKGLYCQQFIKLFLSCK